MIRFLVIIFLFVVQTHAQGSRTQRFSIQERVIINDIITQFKKECGHVSLLDQTKLSEIQSAYSKNKSDLRFDQNECFEAYLSQIVGGHRIY